MTTWTSIADMKRSLTVGTVVLVENLRHPSLTGPRTVLRAQTKTLCLTFPEGHEKFLPVPTSDRNGSWLDFPRAKDVRFEDGKAVFLSEGEPWLLLSAKEDA